MNMQISRTCKCERTHKICVTLTNPMRVGRSIPDSESIMLRSNCFNFKREELYEMTAFLLIYGSGCAADG